MKSCYRGVQKNGSFYVVNVPKVLFPTVGKYSVSFRTIEEAIKQKEEWHNLYWVKTPNSVDNEEDYGIDWSIIENQFAQLKGKSSIDSSLLKAVKQQLFGLVSINSRFRFYVHFPTCTRTYALRTEDDIPLVKNTLIKAHYDISKGNHIKRDKLNIKACEEYRKDCTHIAFTGKSYVVSLPTSIPSDLKISKTKFAKYEDAKALRDSLAHYYKCTRNRGGCIPYFREYSKEKSDSLPNDLEIKLEALKCLARPDTDTHYAEDVYILNEKDHTYHHLGPCSKFEILTSIVKCGTSEVVVLSKSDDRTYKVLNILA